MILELSGADREVLADAAATVDRDFVDAPEEFVLEAQVQAARLSPGLRQALLRFRRFGDPSGGLLIAGVPLGPVPATPMRAGSGETPNAAVTAMSVLLACLGDQYGFRPELGGRIVQDIVPVRGFETQQISIGSTTDLDSHVEMAFSEHRSDFVALLCAREDHDGEAGTTLSSIDRMLPRLSADTVGVLRSPRFRTRVDPSFRLGDDIDGDIWIEPIAVLRGPPERPRLRVDFAETEALDSGAAPALDEMRAVATDTREVFHLRPGELLVVDNHRAVHGRTPFVPRYDGADRWLLRSFVTRDLAGSRDVRPDDGRIVEADYHPADAA